MGTVRWLLLVAAAHSLGRCFFLPSARPVAYTPHPERVEDPLGRLAAAARVERQCAAGVAVRQEGSAVVFESSCSRTERIDLAKVSRIDIVFGDWYALRLFEGDKEQSESVALRYSDEAAATLAADSLWALKQRREEKR